MKEIIAYSSCPNDTYIFGPLTTGLVRGNEFESFIADIDVLNKNALSGKYSISKMSAVTALSSSNSYEIIDCGGAFALDGGPLLVTRENVLLDEGSVIALPGLTTTAALLFRRYHPNMRNFVSMRFDEIIPAIVSGRVEAGVLIHEGRFVYKNYGLVMFSDLGGCWFNELSLPLPLGVIAVKKESPWIDKRMLLEGYIRESIEFSEKNFELVYPYIESQAQEMAREVVELHISAYVNCYSFNMGEDGMKGLRVLQTFLGE